MTSPTEWSFDEEKIFEKAIIEYPNPELVLSGTADWAAIAESLPGKTAEDVAFHFCELSRDLSEAVAGRIKVPNYTKKKEHSNPDKRKGLPWTEEEHRLFLKGIRQFGKGNWRSIALELVKTKTPTQVASHAQKYYLRHNNKDIDNNNDGKKVKRRSSIHDLYEDVLTNTPLPISQPDFDHHHHATHDLPMSQPHVDHHHHSAEASTISQTHFDHHHHTTDDLLSVSQTYVNHHHHHTTGDFSISHPQFDHHHYAASDFPISHPHVNHNHYTIDASPISQVGSLDNQDLSV